MKSQNYLNEVEDRVVELVAQWEEGMDERADVPPRGSKQPSDEDYFLGMMAKYPPELWTVPGLGEVFMSGFELWLMLDKRLTNGPDVLKRIQRGREKVQ